METQEELFEETIQNKINYAHECSPVDGKQYSVIELIKDFMDENKVTKDTDKISLTYLIEVYSLINNEHIEHERNLVNAERVFKYFMNLHLLDSSKINYDHKFKTNKEIEEIFNKPAAMFGPG